MPVCGNIWGNTGMPKRTGSAQRRLTPLEALAHIPNIWDDIYGRIRGGYAIIAVEAMPASKVAIAGNAIYVAEADFYKWVFFNNDVSEKAVEFACNHAKAKLARFIDNLA